MRRAEQEPTRLVSLFDIMSTPAFAAGVTDVRRGKQFRSAYERQDPAWQQLYEWGRQWATVAGPEVKLKGASGGLTAEAARIALAMNADGGWS
jgi:hypothetical protein